MSTDRNTEPAGTLGTPAEATRPHGLILPPGFVDAIDPATGQIVAVRIQEQPRPSPTSEPGRELSTFEKGQRYAAEQPDPLPAVPPPAPQGISPVVGQAVVLGSIGAFGLLAAGGAVYIACAGLHVAGPSFRDAGEFLKYATVFIVAAVVAGVVAVRKLKNAMTATRTSDGTTVNALFHRHTEVHIRKQSAGWKGQVHNNVR